MNIGGDVFGYEKKLAKYNQSIADIKARALEIANPELITTDEIEGVPVEGEFYLWPGTFEKRKRRQLPGCVAAHLVLPPEEKNMKTDNELIAEFMGIERHPKEKHLFWIPENGSWNNWEHLRYNKSWDWLMLVVEKIEQMTGVVYSIEIHIGVCCRIYADGKDIETMDQGIDAVYKAVVEFIKWHSQQNP